MVHRLLDVSWRLWCISCLRFIYLPGEKLWSEKCYPGDALNLTRKEYVDFSMKMKPYIHPRVGGVTKLSMFTDGCGQYLKDCGYGAEFETLDGDKPYEEAEKFVKKAIERNLPVIYLMLRHRDKEFKDLNWHWFCITGYKTEKEEVQQRQIKILVSTQLPFRQMK